MPASGSSLFYIFIKKRTIHTTDYDGLLTQSMIN